jgi:hypothetical protein
VLDHVLPQLPRGPDDASPHRVRPVAPWTSCEPYVSWTIAFIGLSCSGCRRCRLSARRAHRRGVAVLWSTAPGSLGLAVTLLEQPGGQGTFLNTRAGDGVARLASADLLGETCCGESGGPRDHRLVDRHRLRRRLASLADRGSPSGRITSCPSGLHPSTTRCRVLDASKRGAHQDHGRVSPQRLRGRDYLLPLLDWQLSPTPLRLGGPSYQRRRRSHRLSGETGQWARGRDLEPCRALALRGSLLPPRT